MLSEYGVEALERVRELRQAQQAIEAFAPAQPPVASGKPFRIGSRLVDIWVIPVSYVDNEQVIEVRKV